MLTVKRKYAKLKWFHKSKRHHRQRRTALVEDTYRPPTIKMSITKLLKISIFIATGKIQTINTYLAFFGAYSGYKMPDIDTQIYIPTVYNVLIQANVKTTNFIARYK